MADMLSNFADWLRKPYSEDMSAFGWFAFFGLVIIVIGLWATIIRKIETVAAA